MKRFSVVAVFAALCTLMLVLMPGTASAQVTEVPAPNNGVNCVQRIGGAWPEDGHFYYCGTSSTNKTEVLTIIKNLRDSYPNIASKLGTTSGVGATYVVTKDAVDYYKWTAAPGSTFTTPELMALYAAQRGNGAFSSPTAHFTGIYENYITAGGTYPATTAVPIDQMRRAVVHETGHQYDWVSSTHRSEQSTFLRAQRKDRTQMELQAEGSANTAAALLEDYGTFLIKSVPQGSAPGTLPNYWELYAEEFAYLVIADHGAAWGLPADPLNFSGLKARVLTPYYTCSRLVVQKHVINDRDPNATELQVAGCNGTVLCYLYNAPSGTYPANGENAYICGPSTDADPPATLGVNNLPSQARYEELYESGLNTELAKPANSTVRTKLSDTQPDAQGPTKVPVTYFFFRTRDEANDFFSKQRPVKNNNGYQPGTTSTERCGHTFYNSSGVIVAAAIFDQCTLSTGQVTNPSLLRTAIHETGHAFAMAYAKAGQPRPDQTSGFSSLYATDKTKLTPTNWTTATPPATPYTSTQKDAYICGMFGTVGNSQYERDLGSHATQTGPVCTGTSVNSPWKSGTTYHTPSQIATNDLKVPSSFLGSSSYVEAWAEEFTVILLGKTSPSTLLPITDWFFGNGPTTAGGVTTPRAMNCTRFVVETYRSTGSRPTDPQLTGQGCAAQPNL